MSALRFISRYYLPAYGFQAASRVNRPALAAICMGNHANHRFASQSSSGNPQFKRPTRPAEEKFTKSDYLLMFVAASFGVGLTVFAAYAKSHALSQDDTRDKKSNSIVWDSQNSAGRLGEKKKLFKRTEVAQHNSIEKGVWITYKGNVYDITEFIKHHPGGSHTIMLGAGGDVEPFWNTYTVHHASEVQALLARYKIGELVAEDKLEVRDMVADDENNPYANDPPRNPLLRVHTKQPFNAETPPKLLMPTYITPTDIFFVRNHLPVPEVDLANYKLTICTGTDGDPDNLKVLGEFSLDDLKTKFKSYTVDSVIQCSGNRRNDLKRIKEVKGLDWSVGAISNARWTGVRLLDLLDYLAVKRNDPNIKHVQLEGLDCDMTGQSYGASVSADFAFDPNKEVLLAYEMNGQPLTRDHGFPLRFIAPGVTGARNVKWLSKIILSHEESNSHWQRKDYKSFSPNVDMFNLNFDESASIQETPVQSAICDPLDGEKVNVIWTGDGQSRKAHLPVKGYAYSGGGKMIIRVDVSADGGKNWTTAKLLDVPTDDRGLPDYTRRNQVFAWTRWSAELPITNDLLEGAKNKLDSVEILCRAFDSSYNSQPERAETIWNVRGVVNNSWHKVKIHLSTSVE
jgi:sulfite oxidase